ncbi:hypothetical protein [Aerolutibacter ruishenii]|nr:hypothetical protein [Lysobacter ruishenii]
MRADLEAIRQLCDAPPSKDCPSLEVVLSWLRWVQFVAEKRFDAPMPPYLSGRTVEDDLRSDLRFLIELASRHQDRHQEPPLADVACPRQWPEWFGPLPGSARRREWKFSDSGIRQTACLRWRRSYLFFAVRTLVGTKSYGSLIAETSSKFPAWTVWWEELLGRLGPQQRETLEWHQKVSMKSFV